MVSVTLTSTTLAGRNGGTKTQGKELPTRKIENKDPKIQRSKEILTTYDQDSKKILQLTDKNKFEETMKMIRKLVTKLMEPDWEDNPGEYWQMNFFTEYRH
jgi:hypothetical protein